MAVRKLETTPEILAESTVYFIPSGPGSGGVTARGLLVCQFQNLNWEWVIYILKLEEKMGILEKIQEIEQEIARTQKNKGEAYSLGE